MISLRCIQAQDEEILFKWANEEEVRKNSFNTREITPEEHHQWFSNLLNDNNSKLYIVVKDNKDVGQVRVQINEEYNLISYSIDKDYRGQKIGTKTLTILKDIYIDKVLVGRVKFENRASICAFENAGYLKYEEYDYIEFRSKNK